VLGDPRIALTWLVNELSRFGSVLKKDQVVITGTCVKPMPIAVGDQVSGDFGELGGISVNIT
jgi:2-keto-4-pentenoate hydratase